jgi:hypothetical protein
MLNWETWEELHTEQRVTLSDGLDMSGDYVYLINSDITLTSTWQSCIIANTDAVAAGNCKIRALIRKNTNSGSLYLFVRGNKSTKNAYILEIKDGIGLYRGLVGSPFNGNYIESSGDYIFPKNVTYHVELAVHTEPDLKTFIQVKLGDREDPETWTTIFSVITENETQLTGYWGFGMGTYTRRENYYFDNIQYFIEY